MLNRKQKLNIYLEADPEKRIFVPKIDITIKNECAYVN